MNRRKCDKRPRPALEWTEQSVGIPGKITSTRQECDGTSTISEPSSSDTPSVDDKQPTLNDLVQLMYVLTNNVLKISVDQANQVGESSPTTQVNQPTREGRYIGSEVLPEFYPNDKAQTVNQWISKVEQFREIYRWDEITTVYNATTKLRGLAKSWYRSLPLVTYTWDEWKVKLERAFPEKNNYHQQLQLMMQRRKRSDETVIEYYYEKLVLLNNCRIMGEDAVSCIIGGMDDKHIVTAAKSKDCKEPEDLLIYLQSLSHDTTPTTNKERYQRKPFGSNNFSGKKELATRRGEEGRFNKRRCYGCGSRDHLLPSCPQRNHQKKCEKCKLTHVGECKRNPSRPVQTIEEQESPGNKYFMQAFIKQKVVRVFVDLGSSSNIIKDKVAKELDLKMGDFTKVLRGYGGGSTKTIGTTEEVEVKLDQAKAYTSFDVVPDSSQEIPVIIGQPFTEQPHIVIHKDRNNLRIYEHYWDELPSVTDLPPLRIPAWAKTSVVIPPRETRDIICYTTELAGELCVEASVRVEENNEYCIPRCVVSVINSEVVIPVINPTNKEVLVKSKEIFIRGEPCSGEKSVLHVTENAGHLDLNEISIGGGLKESQRDRLKQLLTEYRHCFASTIKELGKTQASEMKISLLDERPVTYKPYRMPPSEREKVKEIVGELLQNGIIRESNSPYASPVLLVKKKNGDQRLCIDYRKLNSKLVQDRYPLPRIEDQLNTLHGHRYYTSLDMTSGYYQIPIEESSKNKTAFVTCDGHYEFNRMPFGLSTAPAVFQRMVNKVLGPLRGTVAMAYLDDILIPSRNFEEGMERLNAVLKIVQTNTLTLNPKKCHFFQTSINYLGHEISEEGMRPGREKTKSVENFPVPENVHQVRQFMGLAGFFRQFIQNYAIISRPLTQLTRKGVTWVWGKEQEDAFMALKQLLSERPVLAVYNPNAHTEVHTDASKLGVAGMLLQRTEKGALQPVAFYSRQTTPAEENYHSYELETLAVVETLKKFRIYLLDLEFKVITDCNSIRATSKKKDLVPRIARWWLLIQEFNFTVEHRPGTKMQHIDALSRNAVPNESPINKDEEQLIMRIEIADWVLASQLTDEKLKLIHEILQKKPETDYEVKIHEDYSPENGRIYRITKKGKLWVIPKGMRQQIVKSAHDDCGHFSLEKTLNKVCETYWFPKMRQYVTKYINCCVPCLFHKKPTGKVQGFLHPIEKETTPFHTIHLDHLGPFNISPKGRKYLIVAVEGSTKYAMLKAVKDTKTIPVINFLNSIIETFGVPNRVITDKGTCYTSRAFRRFCEDIGIKHIQTAVATPRANGQVERFNSTILASLAKTCEDDAKWDKEVSNIQFALNNTVHSVTKRTPSELLFGYRPRSRADSRLSNEVQEYRPVVTELQAVREETKRTVESKQDQQKKAFDKKRRPAKNYQQGELVLVQRQSYTEGQSRKLLPAYKGPFRIKKVLPNDRYVVEELPGSYRSKRMRFDNVESAEHLKPWIPSGGVSTSEDEEATSTEDPKGNISEEEGNGERGRSSGQVGRAVSRRQGKWPYKS